MKRFTKRDKYDDVNIIGINSARLYEELDYDEDLTLTFALNKLAWLEDFEDELNFDLITLFKALKGGFYVKTKDINEGFISLVKAKDIRSIDIVMRNIGFVSTKVVLFEDYGKTWALTKEELEEVL